MRQISVEEAQVLLVGETPPFLLDCREEWEHSAANIGGVVIPLGELEDRVGEVGGGRPILVYCHHGVRSVNAAVLLERAGFETMSMRGGIDQWSLRLDPGIPRY